MAKSKSDPIPANFEDALSQLDMIVEDLEGEAVPLADLVNQYDRGMKLLETCQVKLDEAKQRVATIGQSANQDSVSPTDVPESPSEDVKDELF
ncbi:MAG: exodeoxyribonuclease VII small subunit [Verrucomicrobiaceae bacterium]|nr:exodeoxyribonuclease VII small subunit [Verrucomicrobiaceae bacterium]